MQAAAHPPTSADEVSVGKLLADVGFTSLADAGDLAREIDCGAGALSGDVSFVGSFGDDDALEDELSDNAHRGVVSGLQQELLRSWGVSTDAPGHVT